MIEGGCHCGQIRYGFNGIAEYETNCHCTTCQKTSGAPYVAWFTVKKSSLLLLSGKPKPYQSSAHGVRMFCSNCGTLLFFQYTSHSDEIDITTCSLANPELMPPKDHTWVESKLPWVMISDDLPQHEKSPHD